MPELHPYDAKRLRREIKSHVSFAVDSAIFNEDGEWDAPIASVVEAIINEFEEIHGDLTA